MLATNTTSDLLRRLLLNCALISPLWFGVDYPISKNIIGTNIRNNFREYTSVDNYFLKSNRE